MLNGLQIRQIDARTKQTENETEQLRQENARGRQLLASIDGQRLIQIDIGSLDVVDRA